MICSPLGCLTEGYPPENSSLFRPPVRPIIELLTTKCLSLKVTEGLKVTKCLSLKVMLLKHPGNVVVLENGCKVWFCVLLGYDQRRLGVCLYDRRTCGKTDFGYGRRG